MPKIKTVYLIIAVNVLLLMPLVVLGAAYFLNRLGANPVREIQLRTGIYSLVLLVSSLACTPLYTLTGEARLFILRRLLGQYSFLYAAAHLLNLVALDYRFNFKALWQDLAHQRYVLAGLPAFLILLLLAVTSTARWQKRLGRNWKKLHRLVYLAGILAAVHYIWLVKVPVPGPYIYGGILLFLLLFRLPPVGHLATRYLPWWWNRPVG